MRQRCTTNGYCHEWQLVPDTETTHQPSAGRLPSENWPVAILLYLQGSWVLIHLVLSAGAKWDVNMIAQSLAARQTVRGLVKTPPTSRHITPKPPELLSQTNLRVFLAELRGQWYRRLRSSQGWLTLQRGLGCLHIKCHYICRAVSVVDIQIETGRADCSSACSCQRAQAFSWQIPDLRHVDSFASCVDLGKSSSWVDMFDQGLQTISVIAQLFKMFERPKHFSIRFLTSGPVLYPTASPPPPQQTSGDGFSQVYMAS